MRTRWFLVISSRAQWWVDCEGKSFGPFDSIEVAVAGAVRYAEVFNDPGRQSQVWVPDDLGRMYQVWSSGPLAAGGATSGARKHQDSGSAGCADE